MLDRLELGVMQRSRGGLLDEDTTVRELTGCHHEEGESSSPRESKERSPRMLRHFRAADLDRLITLDAMCFAGAFAFDASLMRAMVETPTALTLVAETADKELAGFVIAHCREQGSPDTAYLVTIDVAPEFRREGVGSLLLSTVERVMLRQCSDRMHLHVHTENHGAIRFYERHGYQRRERVARFYSRVKGDAYLYVKRLGS